MIFRTIICLFFLYFSACSASRKPIPLGQIPPRKVATFSDEQYGHKILSALTDKYPLDYNHPRSSEVYNVVDRLSRAISANTDPWHVYIFRDNKLKNAAGTRGNYIFVWTALLDTTKNEDELAAILAHEMSHVLAGHTEPDPNEQIKKLIIGIGSMIAGIAVSSATGTPSIGQNLGRITAGATQEIASGFLLYPYSRELELEADRVGIMIMAEAKYDPREAIAFWERAQKDPAFTASIAFFSTHPPAVDRLVNLKNALPMAIERYQAKQGLENRSAPAPSNSPVNLPKSEFAY